MDIFRIVEESYDKMGEDYHTSRNNEKFNRQLEEFARLLPKSGDVLDAGCGVGHPASRFLAEKGFDVTGVDISGKMIERARENVPMASFFQKNIAELDLPDESFDGVICVYTLWHIPRDLHSDIFLNFHRMLREEGILVLNTGIHESEGMSRFFGEPMLWSTSDPKATMASVRDVGFEVLFEGVISLGGEKQYWVFAQKTAKRT